MTTQEIEQDVIRGVFELGLHAGVPATEYHRWPLASQSRLKVLRDKTPAHLRYEMDHPSPSTPAQVLGTATHTAVLQPDLFDQEYARGPEGDGRTKAVKEALAALREERPEATILAASDFDTCIRMRDAVWSHPVARRLLNQGHAETSAIWEDPQTGTLCKGRFDEIAERIGAVVDLKTTTDASPGKFSRSIYQWAYYLQGAFYKQGARCNGLNIDSFAVIAVENAEPHCVAVYQIHGDAIASGEDELVPLLRTWAECEASGVWPGYPERVEEIGLPPWAYKDIEERVEAS